jgi:ATP-dependent Clp protease ATP-binding subunit ClpC
MNTEPDWRMYTGASRRIVEKAATEANRLGAHEILGEHLLLGILADDNVASSILIRHGIDPERIRTEVESHLVSTTEQSVPSESRIISETLLSVFQFAEEEVLSEGRQYLGTEHLLLGLLKDTNSQAERVLVNAGVSPESVRRELIRLESI